MHNELNVSSFNVSIVVNFEITDKVKLEVLNMATSSIRRNFIVEGQDAIDLYKIS